MKRPKHVWLVLVPRQGEREYHGFWFASRRAALAEARMVRNSSLLHESAMAITVVKAEVEDGTSIDR